MEQPVGARPRHARDLERGRLALRADDKGAKVGRVDAGDRLVKEHGDRRVVDYDG